MACLRNTFHPTTKNGAMTLVRPTLVRLTKSDWLRQNAIFWAYTRVQILDIIGHFNFFQSYIHQKSLCEFTFMADSKNYNHHFITKFV